MPKMNLFLQKVEDFWKDPMGIGGSMLSLPTNHSHNHNHTHTHGGPHTFAQVKPKLKITHQHTHTHHGHHNQVGTFERTRRYHSSLSLHKFVNVGGGSGSASPLRTSSKLSLTVPESKCFIIVEQQPPPPSAPRGLNKGKSKSGIIYDGRNLNVGCGGNNRTVLPKVCEQEPENEQIKLEPDPISFRERNTNFQHLHHRRSANFYE